MSRRIVSVLLSVLFVALVAAPTVVILIDDTIDISCFYASAEEEEGNEKSEKNKEKEVVFLELDLLETDFVLFEAENNLEYFFKQYSKPHLNLISPPPQLYI